MPGDPSQSRLVCVSLALGSTPHSSYIQGSVLASLSYKPQHSIQFLSFDYLIIGHPLERIEY